MEPSQEQQMAQYAVTALHNVSIPGNQAANLISVQGFLEKLASGELIAVDADGYKAMMESALEDTAGASG